ncbi:MAG: transcriptional regulator [Planctomycetota bacterium]|nr:MAG: transcriptional regulator [Planctomycetota bacterium]
MKDAAVDLLFASLAHAGRRRMLDLVMAAPGISVSALATHFDMSRIAVLKHVRTLEACELLISRKEGRTRQLFFNPVPIQQIHDRWTTKYSAFWAETMVDIQARVQRRASGEEPKIA